MLVRALAYALILAATALPPFARAATPAPSEDYYLSECLMTGHELGVCNCMAKAFAPYKNAKPELVSAIMRTYLLEGDLAISEARIKQDLPKLKIMATDAEIANSVAAAAAAFACEEC